MESREVQRSEAQRQWEPEEALLKPAILKLVRDHKESCPGESCNISLFRLLMMVRVMGIPFTREEEMEFF